MAWKPANMKVPNPSPGSTPRCGTPRASSLAGPVKTGGRRTGFSTPERGGRWSSGSRASISEMATGPTSPPLLTWEVSRWCSTWYSEPSALVTRSRAATRVARQPTKADPQGIILDRQATRAAPLAISSDPLAMRADPLGITLARPATLMDPRDT